MSQSYDILFVYADEIYNIRLIKRDANAVSNANKRESTDLGLAINEDKTKYSGR